MTAGAGAMAASPRRGALGVAALVLLVAGLLTARVLWARAAFLRQSVPQVVGALDVARVGVSSWARTYTAQAELLARLVARDPALAADAGASARAEFARRVGPALAVLGRPASPRGPGGDGPYAGESRVDGAWVYDAAGALLAGWPPDAAERATEPRSATVPPAPPRAAAVRTTRRPGGVWADVVVPVLGEPAGDPAGEAGRAEPVLGTVVVRVAVDDRSLPALNPTRPSNRGARATGLARFGDSAVVVSTSTYAERPAPRRAFALGELPRHARAALEGRPTSGQGRGLFGRRVVFAAAPLPDLGWAMLREVDAAFLLGQLTPSLIVEESLLARLFALAAVVVASRLRAGRARRETAIAELRADFVSGVSHELRTPLAQIRMFAELLRKRALRDEGEADRALGIIEKEAGRLAILVDNVLNYARLRRQPVTRWITPVPADVAGEARQVLESFAPLAAERGARIVLAVAPGPRAVIDPQALRQVLLNFLENAVKYGPRGQTVTLGAQALGAGRGAQVRIWVDDEGPGVPPAEREKIWEAFHRAEAAVRSGVGGSGRGLAGVRDLVRPAGGRVAIEAAPGGGARFVAELPMVGGGVG